MNAYKDTQHVDTQRDYKTYVDHTPTALCWVSLHHVITNICAFLCYYSLTVYNYLRHLYYMHA